MINMRAMLFTRRSRSVVAVVTAVLLLLCQTAFAARVCMLVPDTASAATAAPCHGAAEPEQAPAPSVCDAGKATADPVQIQVPALADLPAVRIVYADAAESVVANGPTGPVHADCHSPPLTLLHCRLLN